MKVGGAVIFQNPLNARSDYDVYKDDLRIGDLYEPLGFDSIWSVEHHFDDYTMCPDVLQFLSYYAGRTKNIQLGSMVVVLPWHDPIRVAEQISVIDHQSNGRMIIGFGRGLARIEFEGFRVPLGESRERFIEAAEMIIDGLEKGYIEHNGKHFQQPRRDIRPKPFKSFKGRTYAAAVSPESSRIMAKLGIGILIIPQKPWEAVAQELNEYRTIYRQVNGGEPLPTIAAGWTFVDKSRDRAHEMAVKYIGGYWQTALRHYEMAADHFGKAKGYEYYEQMAKNLAAPGSKDASIDYFLSLQVWGTPEDCINKIDEIRQKVGADHYTGVFSYAGMPIEDAERSLRLFAAEVMPEIKKLNGLKAQAA
ncbi:MAG TPA: LLM class flavin-dependent oxidoreductase [Candidatus Binataceae bacterium]|nr:LLM class flavin-dependent oxidoreductase [Candidatus Binataceae bacterium]